MMHWYSPLDPQVSEIARYSAQLVPIISSLAPITLVSDASSDEQPVWLAGMTQPPLPEPGLAALPVYHIGNNALHYPIWRQSQAQPGLVVLHDANLLDLARFAARQCGQPRQWRSMLADQYGRGLDRLIEQSEYSPEAEQELASSFPLFQPFIESALGVIVHSRYAADLLRQAFPHGPPVLELDLPAPPPPPIPERNYAADPLRFIFCGHVGPNRRLQQFMAAWSQLEQPQRLALDLYGQVGNRTELMRHAAQCGVDRYVTLHGYVDDQALDLALQQAHFALNLRWPTMGEASASQLRYWSAALPTLVTDVGWYAELPDDTVCKISADEEIPAIRAFLEDLLTDPNSFDGVGARGWTRLGERHTAQGYAEGLVEFARELLERRLAHRALEQSLVPAVAAMCASEADIPLFTSAIERAVACLEPETGSVR